LFHAELMTLFGGMFSLASAWGGGGAADAVVVGTPLPPPPLPTDCGGDGQSRAGSSDATDSVPPPKAGLKGPLATDREFVAALLSAFALVPVVAADALVPLTGGSVVGRGGPPRHREWGGRRGSRQSVCAAAVAADTGVLQSPESPGEDTPRPVGPVRLPLVLAEVLPPTRRGSPTLG